MTLKIKLVLDGIQLIDFDILPNNVKEDITKILNYGKYSIVDNIIFTHWDEETVDVICMLNAHFDLFIVKGV